MTRPPLGQVCIELGLLDDSQVESILRDMREHGHGRFGELAVGLNVLSEEQLATALAHQFDLTLLSAERIDRLVVPKDVLGMLPVGLMRSRVLLPTFFEPERRVLTLVTSDPTDLPALQAAQRHARAHQLRIFVAARSTLAAHLDRLLPASSPLETTAASIVGTRGRPGTAVLESDVEVAAALRRLERAEGARTEIVPDPEQVTALLSAGLVDRVLYRDLHQGTVAPYLPIWRKVRPGVSIASVRGYGPGMRIAVSYDRASAFYQELLLWVLSAGESRQLHVRQRMRAGWALVRELGPEVGLLQERLEAVSVAALLSQVGDLSLLGRRGSAEEGGLRLYDEPSSLLARFAPPWDVIGLYAAVDRRVNRPGEVTDDLGAETFLAVRAALEAGTRGNTDAADVLPSGFEYHPRVVDALTRVLQRRVLRSQLLTGGRRQALVVVALRDVPLLTDIERQLEQAGFEVVGAPATDLALNLVRELQPAAVVIGDDLPESGALRLLAEVRHDTILAATPAFVLATGPDGLAKPVHELEPDGVSTPPHDLRALESAIRLAVARPQTGVERSASATGDVELLPLSQVMDALSRSRQTAEVRLVGAEDDGRLNVVEGELHSARLGRHTGPDAWRIASGQRPMRYAVSFGVLPEGHDEDSVSPRG